ncbi:transglycosylase domain-containing protein [Corynebacterium breve]|uniref:Transglycosylase domain-containing protein n=2 Tax=Corynebacterium breve TaxID=3049799 RepID=A0ABY8VLH5_9CORY|nr:transglycosylase domain-containing protein [Corynebacterium breve]WIM69078.1 transglycosylase domain-containing protein [Corynebacterium breve]
MIAIPLGAFGYAYVKVDVPEPGELQTAQVSTIYASDSATELARLVPPEGNRRQVTLDAIPTHVQDAVLAAEDREFWTNQGFSFTGFTRAVIGQLTGNSSAGGGSTITQQYVKNALVGNEHSYVRKARELVYSVKMTNEWSKEEILQAYLNTVYFGRNAYGIEAASHAYYNKPANELSVEEGALLAALIQLPSQLDPWSDREGAETRWNYVLDGMVDMKVLEEGQRAGMAFPETRDPAEYSAYTEASGPNGMIKNQVIRELELIGITEEDVTNRGLQITTTIDNTVQQAAIEASHDNLSPLQEDARAAVVAIEPGTGAVRGYYGGDDASGWDYADAALQTGSTFKIFGLAAALQQGIPLDTYYSSDPVTLPGDIEVTNHNNTGGGSQPISEALKRSFNTSFIRLQDDLTNGTQDTADMAHALGIARELPGIPETLTENGEQPYEGIVLGQYQSRAIDMATAVATLTNHGVWHPTHFVEKVETVDGEVLYQFDPGYSERRVNSQVADATINAMEPIAAYSNGALAGGRYSAAKTGTAQLGDTGLNKDTWMVGSTPQLAVAVWVGTADNTTAIFNEWGGNMYGSGAPTKIWKSVLDRSLEGQEFMSFPDAPPVTWGASSMSFGGGYVPPATTYAPAPTAPARQSSSAAPAPVEPPAEEPPAEEPPAEEPAPTEEPPAEEPAPAPEPVPEVPEVPDIQIPDLDLLIPNGGGL